MKIGHFKAPAATPLSIQPVPPSAPPPNAGRRPKPKARSDESTGAVLGRFFNVYVYVYVNVYVYVYYVYVYVYIYIYTYSNPQIDGKDWKSGSLQI